MVKIVAPKGGKINCSKGNAFMVDQSFLQAASVLFDAIAQHRFWMREKEDEKFPA